MDTAGSKGARTLLRTLILGLVAMTGVLSLSAQGIYDFRVKDDAGKEVALADYKGKVLLIVNTATRCGFTPQYNELEALYEKYAAQGLEILDFPCNQFGQQAPGTIQEIHEFCTANFNISFPQFDKIEVNGPAAHPLYTWLKAQRGFGGFDTNDQRGKMMDGMLRRQDADYDKKADIKWNFTKFLVSRDGRVLKRYEPTDKMTDVETDIQMEVNPVLSTIMARRSVRKYLPTPVEHEKLAIIAKCGINAPSGMNRQPWLVRVVENRQLIDDVNKAAGRSLFYDAPALICVCTPANGGDLDAGLLGENMMLAAQALGLGTCCLGGPVRFLVSDERCKFFLERLDIPADYRLNYILAVGYPDEQPEARPRDASKVQFLTK